jgi:hypothetical protein
MFSFENGPDIETDFSASEFFRYTLNIWDNDSALVYCTWRKTVASWWLHYIVNKFLWLFTKHQIMSYVLNFVDEIFLILTYDLGLTTPFYMMSFIVWSVEPKSCQDQKDFSHEIKNIRHVKGISKKLRCIGNCFNVSIIFKTKHTLQGTLMKTVPVREAQQMKQCVYNIPCDCGRCYIGKTRRPLKVHTKEHKYNLTQGLLENSKLA